MPEHSSRFLLSSQPIENEKFWGKVCYVLILILGTFLNYSRNLGPQTIIIIGSENKKPREIMYLNSFCFGELIERKH